MKILDMTQPSVWEKNTIVNPALDAVLIPEALAPGASLPCMGCAPSLLPAGPPGVPHAASPHCGHCCATSSHRALPALPPPPANTDWPFTSQLNVTFSVPPGPLPLDEGPLTRASHLSPIKGHGVPSVFCYYCPSMRLGPARCVLCSPGPQGPE